MLKRGFDALVAGLALLVLAPFLLLLGLLVRWSMGSPVLFSQIRPGLGGVPFRLYKFRTMRDAVGADDPLLADAARLTPFGRWLRATSLDELPELFNVLRGEMSLVGPRPLLLEYLPLYSPAQARRHEARPGITGWAQVNGRNAVQWPDRFALDLWYVDHHTFRLDLWILVLTVWRVLRRDGISQQGEATMAPFRGDPR